LGGQIQQRQTLHLDINICLLVREPDFIALAQEVSTSPDIGKLDGRKVESSINIMLVKVMRTST
jgi:hypothetical protein